MTQTDIQHLSKKLDAIISAQSDMKQKQDTIERKLDTVFEIYTSLQGFGGIVWWLFKYLVIPISVIVGIIFTVKRIKQ